MGNSPSHRAGRAPSRHADPQPLSAATRGHRTLRATPPRRPGDGISRRSVLRLLGVTGLTAAAGGVISAATPSDSRQGSAPGEPTRADRPPDRHDFILTASEFDWELMPGTTVRVWGYNGQMPGPELRVREGDHVRVTLRNHLPVPTTIHWHGVNVPNAMDGVAGLNQAPVPPGDEFVYEFTATPAGSRWYHSHTDPALQVPLGLYGPFVIEPRQPRRTYDRDSTYFLAEWDQELTPAVATGKAERGPGDRMLRGGELGTDYFLLNGRMHGAVPPIRITQGERILIRLMHAGAQPHVFHTHGHAFKIVATDGFPVPEAAQLTKDSLLIGPAERYDLQLLGNNPGVWMVHCHMEHHMANGMMTLLTYDGAKPTGPAAALFEPGGMEEGHDMATPVTPDHLTPAPTVAPALSPTAGHLFEVTLVDDRFEPVAITVPVGATVRWVNNGADWHSIAAFDGSFKDDHIAPGASYEHHFTKPGLYQYICQHHALQGMTGAVAVQ